MATQNNLHIPDDLLADLRAKAQAEGKTVDELAEEALRQCLEERQWADIVNRTRPYVEGVSDSEIDSRRAEYRKEHSTRRAR
jgi:hypothetical protein